MRAELQHATEERFLFVLRAECFEEAMSMNAEEVLTFFEASDFLASILPFVQQSRPGESLRMTRDGTVLHCGLPTRTHRPAAHKVFVPAEHTQHHFENNAAYRQTSYACR